MAVRFGIRDYSRVGNDIQFTLVALNANGSIDTGFTGSVQWLALSLSGLPSFTFAPGDAGSRVITATITGNAALAIATLVGDSSFPRASLAVHNGPGVATTSGENGDSLWVGHSTADTFTSNSTTANDLFMLQLGGDDTASGGGGNDGFYFGGAYTSADVVNGGAGSADQIAFQGNYSTGVTLGSITGIEALVFLPGNDTRFGDTAGNTYSYTIASPDAAVAAGQQMIVQGNTLRAGENLIFNGAAETDGSFLMFAGLGGESLSGGAGSDGFFFGQGRFGSNSVVIGNGGADQIGFQGNFTLSGSGPLVFGATQISSIEFMVLLSAVDTRFGASGGIARYELTMNNGNVGAGQRMVIQGNTLQAGERLNFDGRAELDGSFQIFSGAANDFLAGSRGADDIFGGAGTDQIIGDGGADMLRGGTGNDSFLYVLTSDSTDAARDQILDFTTGDKVDLTFVRLNSGGSDFSFIGSGAQTGARQVQVVQLLDFATVRVYVDADSNADLVINLTVPDFHTLTAADFAGLTAAGQEPLNDLAMFGLDHDQPDEAYFGLFARDQGARDDLVLDLGTGPLAQPQFPGDDLATSGALARSVLYDGLAMDPASLPDMASVGPMADLLMLTPSHDLIV